MINLIQNNDVVKCIILFILAILLQYLIAWVGSVLTTIPLIGEIQYSSFTFSETLNNNRNISGNILLNVFMPNIVMIFVYIVSINFQINYVNNSIMYFVIFYYLYRWILIHIILKRKELFNYPYEICLAFSSIALSYLISNFYLVSTDNLFIPLDEFKNEIWIVIIFLIYKFIIAIINKIYSEHNLVSENMKNRYIYKRFKKFFNKFNNDININIEDKDIWVLLFSIMIKEDYHRGIILRMIEKIKVCFGYSATIGIMQVYSSKLITDLESIRIAYDKILQIKNNYYQNNDLCTNYYIAWEYNNSEEYALEVENINNILCEHIENIPLYRKFFKCREETQNGEDVVDKQESVCSETKFFTTYHILNEDYLFLEEAAITYKIKKKTIIKNIRKSERNILVKQSEVIRLIGNCSENK